MGGGSDRKKFGAPPLWISKNVRYACRFASRVAEHRPVQLAQLPIYSRQAILTQSQVVGRTRTTLWTRPTTAKAVTAATTAGVMTNYRIGPCVLAAPRHEESVLVWAP